MSTPKTDSFAAMFEQTKSPPRTKNPRVGDKLDAIVPPKDWSPSWHGSPRKIVREEHRV